MEAIEDIMTRTSQRRFEVDRPVSDSDIRTLLRAAMAAPSGVNRQPWHFCVITDRRRLDSLAAELPYCKMAATAPLAIVVCGNNERFLEGIDSELWVQDCSAATENILLAAHALGLGAVWTSVYPHTDRATSVAKILNLTNNLIPFNVIPVGYAADSHSPIDKWHPERVTYY